MIAEKPARHAFAPFEAENIANCDGSITGAGQKFGEGRQRGRGSCGERLTSPLGRRRDLSESARNNAGASLFSRKNSLLSRDSALFQETKRPVFRIGSRFQVHLARQEIGVATINAAIAALRFFFNVTLERPDLVRHLTTANKPRRAPVVLSQEEVARLLEAAPRLKYEARHDVAEIVFRERGLVVDRAG